MKRIRHLALVAIAALALTASIGAGTASASKFVPELGGSKSVQGRQVEGFATFESPWIATKCLKSSLEGSISGISSELTALIGPFSECTNEYLSEGKANGCNFIFHPGAESKPGFFGGTVDIGPSNCGPIVFTTEPNHICKLSYYPKTGITASYSNIGEGSSAEVLVSFSATEVKVKGEGFCGAGKTAETGKIINLTYDLGATGGLRIEEHPHRGLYIGKEGTQQQFLAELYPAIAKVEQAEQTKPIHFRTTEGSGKCAVLGGSGTLSAAAPSFEVLAEARECEFFSLETTSHVNGCGFAFTVSNSGPPYAGTLSLSCPAGKSLEFETLSSGKQVCTVSYPPQNLASVTFTNEGTGPGRYVLASLTGKEMKYSITNASGVCGVSGEHSDGSIKAGSLRFDALES